MFVCFACVGWVLVVTGRLSIAACGLPFSYSMHASERMGSAAAVCGLSYLGACGILVLSPGIEPASSALEGRFITTGPPRKSHCWIFDCEAFFHSLWCLFIGEKTSLERESGYPKIRHHNLGPCVLIPSLT